MQRPSDFSKRWERFVTRRPILNFILVTTNSSFDQSVISGPNYFGFLLKCICSCMSFPGPWSERLLISSVILSCKTKKYLNFSMLVCRTNAFLPDVESFSYTGLFSSSSVMKVLNFFWSFLTSFRKFVLCCPLVSLLSDITFSEGLSCYSTSTFRDIVG